MWRWCQARAMRWFTSLKRWLKTVALTRRYHPRNGRAHIVSGAVRTCPCSSAIPAPAPKVICCRYWGQTVRIVLSGYNKPTCPQKFHENNTLQAFPFSTPYLVRVVAGNRRPLSNTQPIVGIVPHKAITKEAGQCRFPKISCSLMTFILLIS